MRVFIGLSRPDYMARVHYVPDQSGCFRRECMFIVGLAHDIQILQYHWKACFLYRT